MVRANALLGEFLKKPDYEMVFQPLNFEECGLVVVTDSSLGTVTRDGSAEAPPLEKVYSQACYFVLLADTELMAGRPGKFNVLDMRSHRLTRVCRSSYAAETLGAEEAFDVGQLCRGFVAAARGFDLQGKAESGGHRPQPQRGSSDCGGGRQGRLRQGRLGHWFVWLSEILGLHHCLVEGDTAATQHELALDQYGQHVRRRRD